MHIIFDFDGTIVDSFNAIVLKYNILADEFHFRKIDFNEIDALRDLSSRELIRHLQIPILKIPRIIYQARKYMNTEMSNMLPFTDMHMVLKQLYDKQFSLGILTSNSIENVKMWLDLHDMGHFFQFIYSDYFYFGKTNMLKKILKKYHINKSVAFYIGDETRDIEAAKKNAIYSVAVTWGFNSEKILAEYQPNFIARKPDDLLAIFG